MSAEERIRRTLALYVQKVDDRDIDGCVALFAANARHISRSGQRSGHSGIRQYLTDLYANAPRGWRTKHFLSSPVIDLDGDTAEVVSDVVVYECFDDLPWAIRETGRHRDRLVLEDSEWRFAEKRVESDTFVLSGPRSVK